MVKNKSQNLFKLFFKYYKYPMLRLNQGLPGSNPVNPFSFPYPYLGNLLQMYVGKKCKLVVTTFTLGR
jgi:hypothetical protein